MTKIQIDGNNIYFGIYKNLSNEYNSFIDKEKPTTNQPDSNKKKIASHGVHYL